MLQFVSLWKVTQAKKKHPDASNYQLFNQIPNANQMLLQFANLWKITQAQKNIWMHPNDPITSYSIKFPCNSVLLQFVSLWKITQA